MCIIIQLIMIFGKGFAALLGREIRYTSLATYTDRSCADVICHCVVFISAVCYPSFLYVRYLWKPV